MAKINMKINYVELARTWNVDYRTAKKYFLAEPGNEKQTRNSKISHLHETMVYLLSKENYEQTLSINLVIIYINIPQTNFGKVIIWCFIHIQIYSNNF